MKTSKYFILTFIIAFAFGCKDDDIPPIGEPFDKGEGLTATDWLVAEAYLVDQSNPANPERDISGFYTESDNQLELSFNIDGTFEVVPGDGLNFFPESGTWSFDDPDYPRNLLLVSEEGATTVAPLGGPTRISDQQLKIIFTKRTCTEEGVEKPILGYRLVFNRKS
ncbi:MAG: DUF5004 domain-containing protein [Flavobacteriales bacterium]|nr:DUF5004 domain-containing protein [Flavobacteriales bacterium]